MVNRIKRIIDLIFSDIYWIDIPVKIKNYKNLKVLDVGAGYNPRLIADITVDKYLIYEGRKIDRSVVSYLTEVYDLPFVDNYFDIAISNHVFEHLENPKKAFKEINRVAKNVLIITPTALREAFSTGRDHFWFVYGSKGKLAFEAIPTNFKKDKIKRKFYQDKFSRINNIFRFNSRGESLITEETVYFKESTKDDSVIEVMGEIDYKRFYENQQKFNKAVISNSVSKLKLKKKIPLFYKKLLRYYIKNSKPKFHNIFKRQNNI